MRRWTCHCVRPPVEVQISLTGAPNSPPPQGAQVDEDTGGIVSCAFVGTSTEEVVANLICKVCEEEAACSRCGGCRASGQTMERVRCRAVLK